MIYFLSSYFNLFFMQLQLNIRQQQHPASHLYSSTDFTSESCSEHPKSSAVFVWELSSGGTVCQGYQTEIHTQQQRHFNISELPFFSYGPLYESSHVQNCWPLNRRAYIFLLLNRLKTRGTGVWSDLVWNKPDPKCNQLEQAQLEKEPLQQLKWAEQGASIHVLRSSSHSLCASAYRFFHQIRAGSGHVKTSAPVLPPTFVNVQMPYFKSVFTTFAQGNYGEEVKINFWSMTTLNSCIKVVCTTRPSTTPTSTP